jgi:hypothetical protein
MLYHIKLYFIILHYKNKKYTYQKVDVDFPPFVTDRGSQRTGQQSHMPGTRPVGSQPEWPPWTLCADGDAM